MFKRAMTLLCMTSVLSAGLLDFQTLEKAKSSYESGHYEESAKNYGAIEEKSDALHYNLGNAYYKEKQYDKAISEFKQVNAPELKAKSLHNLGNAYAQSKKIDEAIAAYEEALKLGDDQDTKFNLDLLKKQKQQQQKKQQKQDKNKDQQNKEQDQKQQDQKDQQQKSQDQKDQQQKDKEQKNKDQKSQEQKQQDQKDQQQKDQENKDQQKSEAEKKAEEEKKKAAQEKKRKEEAKRKEEEKAQEGKPQEMPISDMQERKYEKMLDKRGIKTLMVPLKTKGGRDEETTAW